MGNMTAERRHLPQRTAVLRAIVAHIVHAPDVTVTLTSLQTLAQVPREAAERLVARLVAGGVLTRLNRDVWVSAPWTPRSTT
jgi:hypothetical protein